MLLTEQGKEFLENISLYKDFGLHTLVNISGIEILKNNKILPVCTIYLESDEGDILFVADYCTPREEKELVTKIKKNLDIKKELNFTIKENEGKEKDQEMIKYIAYSNPDIRPVLFSGEVQLDDNKVSIKGNKILLNDEENRPQNFITTLFSPDNSPETKLKLINEIDKRKNELMAIIEQLLLLSSVLGKEAVIPKIIEANGDAVPAIVFKDELGKYKAVTIGVDKPELVSKFKIMKDFTWSKLIEQVNNNDFINNNKDELIEKLIEGAELGD